MTKGKIFLSYRRDDSEAETRTIQIALVQSGYDVFIDRIGIQPGDRWKDKIKNALRDSSIVISVIGDKWLTSSDLDGRRRIDGDEDWVRFELGTALETDKTIIPLLINKAQMPAPKSLPDNLRNYQAGKPSPVHKKTGRMTLRI